MSDRISLRGIEVQARHGATPEERERTQLFRVDLEVELDLRDAARGDRLEDTVDYGVLAERVERLVAGESWNLIETVAERIAGLVLEDQRVAAVEVTVHKPEAPIEVPFEDVAVTVRRERRV